MGCGMGWDVGWWKYGMDARWCATCNTSPNDEGTIGAHAKGDGTGGGGSGGSVGGSEGSLSSAIG